MYVFDILLSDLLNKSVGPFPGPEERGPADQIGDTVRRSQTVSLSVFTPAPNPPYLIISQSKLEAILWDIISLF